MSDWRGRLDGSRRRVVSLLEILRSHAELYVKSASVLGRIGERCRIKSNPFADPVAMQLLSGQLEDLLAQCQTVDLPITARHITRVQFAIANLDMTDVNITGTMGMRLSELESRLEDELETKLFFQLPAERKDFYDKPRDGWESILESFSEAAMDVEEMRKCYALSRYAASVFHSLLVIEHGLIRLGRFLNVHDHQTGWNATTNELNRIVRCDHTKRTQSEREHFVFIEQIQGTVQALKNAWRNKISHAGEKLYLASGETFTPDIAEEIMYASRSFMRRLMEDMPIIPLRKESAA